MSQLLLQAPGEVVSTRGQRPHQAVPLCPAEGASWLGDASKGSRWRTQERRLEVLEREGSGLGEEGMTNALSLSGGLKAAGRASAVGEESTGTS